MEVNQGLEQGVLSCDFRAWSAWPWQPTGGKKVCGAFFLFNHPFAYLHAGGALAIIDPDMLALKRTWCLYEMW